MKKNDKKKNEVALHPIVIINSEKTKNNFDKVANEIAIKYKAFVLPCKVGDKGIGLFLFSTLAKRSQFMEEAKEYLDLAFGDACIYVLKNQIQDKEIIKEAEEEWKMLNGKNL